MRFISIAVVSLLAGLGACGVISRQATTKPIVAHYMIGEIYDDHVRQDIVDAKALGLDGFALNYDQFAGWSNRTVDFLFNHADNLGFKLFFSFDHAAGYLSGNPNQYADYFRWYTGRSSYFKFKDPKTGRVMPLMSTFGGEDVPDSQWADFKRKVGDVLIVPAFYKAAASTSFFDNRGSLDGVMNWNSWQYEGAGKIRVSSADDAKFQTAARNTQKVFMMGISPYQYKAFSPQFNWYRRGEDNLEYRFGQALDLQPDIIQLQSWNDAGEGHFMGNVWQEPLNQRTKDLTNAYSHKGYWQILPSFIRSWKQGDRSTVNMYPTSGKAIQGTFWHHTLTVGASCDADTVVDKSPFVQQLAEDAVSGVVLVAWAYTGLVAVVNSGGREIGKMTLQPGYNSFKFGNMGTGKVQLEIWDGTRIAAGGSGPLEVRSSGPLCNWNFQVVGLSA